MTTMATAARMAAPSIQAMFFCSSTVTPSTRDTSAAMIRMIRVLSWERKGAEEGEGLQLTIGAIGSDTLARTVINRVARKAGEDA